MPALSSEPKLFGLDLRMAGNALRALGQFFQSSRLGRWLMPSADVRYVRARGDEVLWTSAGIRTRDPRAPAPRFVAVELPEDWVLRRTLPLPDDLSPDNQSAAMALEARAHSPFVATDLVWAFHRQADASTGRSMAELVMASRPQIEAYLATQAARLPQGIVPEVWVPVSQGRPGDVIVLPGFGEAARRAHAQRRQGGMLALVGLLLALLLAIAVTPTAQLRLRAIDAVHAYDELVRATYPVVAEREQLLRTVEQIREVTELIEGQYDALKLLDTLTRILPDDTAIQSFKLQGAKLTLSGLTGNASALMQLLGDQPGFRDVKAPTPATRYGVTNKEQFVVELQLDAALYARMPPAAAVSGAASAASVPSSPEGATSAAAAAPASVPAAVPAAMPPSAPASGLASAPAAVPASVPASVPAVARTPSASTGGAVFGGGATFGASPAAKPATPASAPTKP
ncbi:MAG: PilN domain-containing protein [Burkholderiaceae bacterium]